VNLAVGLTYILSWIGWAVKSRAQRPYALKVVVMVISVALVSLLEVLDFPPFGRCHERVTSFCGVFCVAFFVALCVILCIVVFLLQ
jgi:hypothetical protein